MNILAEIQSRGAGVSLDDSGKLDLDLSRVRPGDRVAVVAIAKQHKQAIIDALQGGPSGSANCPPARRIWSEIPGTHLSECVACERFRCVMLTMDVPLVRM